MSICLIWMVDTNRSPSGITRIKHNFTDNEISSQLQLGYHYILQMYYIAVSAAWILLHRFITQLCLCSRIYAFSFIRIIQSLRPLPLTQGFSNLFLSETPNILLYAKDIQIDTHLAEDPHYYFRPSCLPAGFQLEQPLILMSRGGVLLMVGNVKPIIRTHILSLEHLVMLKREEH